MRLSRDIHISFRLKLFIAFTGLIWLSLGTVFVLVAKHSREVVLERIQSSVLSIAIAAADQVDVEAHQTINTEADRDSPAYRSIVESLRRVRDQNRRDDLYTAFIYSTRKIASNPDRWIYVVDAEEPGDDHSQIGDEISWEEEGTPDGEPLVLGPAYVDSKFATDEYGVWLSGYAPLHDTGGRIVGMVGVDLAADTVTAQQNKIIRLSLTGLIIGLVASLILSDLLAKWAASPMQQIAHTIDRIGTGRFETRLPDRTGDEFSTVANAVNNLARTLHERDALRGALSHMVSQETAQRLIDENALPRLRGDRRQVTVLVGDITNLSEHAGRRPPEELIDHLNEYFASMVAVIFRHNGTIDRLVGNRLVAVFGAPCDDPEMEHNAVSAAIAMRNEDIRLQKKWHLAPGSHFGLRVGIHTGSAVLGNVGTDGNVAFTVVGDSFDTASRIRSEVKNERFNLLASESTVTKIQKQFRFHEVGEITRPGSTDFIRVFAIGT